MNLLAALRNRLVAQQPPRKPPLPLYKAGPVTRYRFPLLTHGRAVLEPQVSVGEPIMEGQSLAEGVVSSIEGIVECIDAQPFAHPSGLSVLSVTVQAMPVPDSSEPAPDTSDEESSSRVEPAIHALTIERLHRYGVSGMGGAGFSTANKFSAIQQHAIHTLLINAVECDPDIRCDEALMINEPDSVMQGIHALAELGQCQNCIIAIEEDKSEAIAAMRSALGRLPDSDARVKFELRLIEPVYPSGAERILIRLTCGIEVVPPKRPADYGVLCVNVSTAHAAGRAARGQALTTRIVTIGGPAALNPCNAYARLGTPLSSILETTGNLHDPERHRLRIGGGISGYDLHDAQSPVTATTNCLSIELRSPESAALPCIRCGACSDVCPVNLLPQQLYWHIQAGDLEGAARQRVDHCIECACCDRVCPSAIELTNLFRHARGERQLQAMQIRDAELAKHRHESHARRESLREARAQEQIRERKAALNDPAAASAAALERVRNRRNRPSS